MAKVSVLSDIARKVKANEDRAAQLREQVARTGPEWKTTAKRFAMLADIAELQGDRFYKQFCDLMAANSRVSADSVLQLPELMNEIREVSNNQIEIAKALEEFTAQISSKLDANVETLKKETDITEKIKEGTDALEKNLKGMISQIPRATLDSKEILILIRKENGPIKSQLTNINKKFAELKEAKPVVEPVYTPGSYDVDVVSHDSQGRISKVKIKEKT